jgi:hypothetical protein
MSKTGHVHVSETVARRVASTKARRGGRPRKNSANKSSVHKNGTPVPKNASNEAASTEAAADDPVAEEAKTRAKGLLAATLRVWELKHRISE